MDSQNSIDTFIVKHTELLAKIIALILIVWFVTGIIAIDYIHPILFVAVWIPIGLAGAWWSAKW